MQHSDCTNALNDSRLKADRMATVLGIKYPQRVLPPDNIYHRFTKNIMMFADPPLHDALRRSTRVAFTREANAHYDTVIKKIANDLVASIPSSRREIDAVPELAAKLPVLAAIHAFGLPEEDLDFVRPLVDIIMTYWSGPQDQPLPLDNLLDRLTELHTYVFELTQNLRGRAPSGTAIARLLESQSSNVDSTLEQTIHQLVLVLMAMLAPTTPGSLSSGILSFATNPRQVDRFLSDSHCCANAANEVFRYNASNQFTWRVAGASLEIGGVSIEKDQAVTLFIGSANRDFRVFEQPNEFNLDRTNSGRHLTLGIGPHSCLGRGIASMELSWFFTALLNRYPGLRLAGDPVWNSNLEFRSLKSLPVRLC
jgi:4-nitrotryptophan synthase